MSQTILNSSVLQIRYFSKQQSSTVCNVSLLLNGTSALFRPLVPRIVCLFTVCNSWYTIIYSFQKDGLEARVWTSVPEVEPWTACTVMHEWTCRHTARDGALTKNKTSQTDWQTDRQCCDYIAENLPNHDRHKWTHILDEVVHKTC